MNLSKTIIDLLNNRGINGEEDILEFLSDSPKKTYDPYLMSDMKAGVDLILSEIENGSKICIYGDYDADGITATSLMMSVLSHLIPKDELNSRLDYYIPSRFDEGYGLNMSAIDTIKNNGFDMIITVDCGSVNKDEVEYAKSLGLKILVTDHHNITDVMADCLLINPKKPNSNYPFKEICGCGVAFKLAQALQKQANLPKTVLTEVLDLVAIGTIGDVMPLIDENRTFVKFGLKVLNQTHRIGLKKLIEGADLKFGHITSENIAFVIVPHLNASGRIEDASQAVRLLISKSDDTETDELAQSLLQKNKERKHLQNTTYDECTEILNQNLPIQNFIFIKAENAHEGITGIVAGKLKENYYRPAVIVTPTGNEDEYFKGTGRSIEGVSLYDLLKKYQDLFVKFGGHSGACGFLIEAKDVDTLKDGLIRDMNEIAKDEPDLLQKKYQVDMDIDIKDLTVQLAEEIEMLAPFGNGNPKPAFQIITQSITDIRFMGDENKHVSFYARSSEGNSIRCVLFGKAKEYQEKLNSNSEHRIIGAFDKQIWQGKTKLQLIVEEIF